MSGRQSADRELRPALEGASAWVPARTCRTWRASEFFPQSAGDTVPTFLQFPPFPAFFYICPKYFLHALPPLMANR